LKKALAAAGNEGNSRKTVMPLKIRKAIARERLASRRSPTRIPDRLATDPVAVTGGTNGAAAAVERMLTSPEASKFLRLSESWLAKARMRGDGPPYAKFGRSIRYAEATLVQWMKSHLRQSTSER
jgi:predicted DNA-binding transcriptional regulator AlpA